MEEYTFVEYNKNQYIYSYMLKILYFTFNWYFYHHSLNMSKVLRNRRKYSLLFVIVKIDKHFLTIRI